MRFVAVAQTFENLDRFVDGGLADHDGLEPPLERRVFLDVLAELVERRRADALELAAGQRRLDDVAGVDRAFGRAGADEAGGDDKVVAVLAKDPRWGHIQDVADVDEWTKNEINHFFEHYKDLEPGKSVEGATWVGRAEAEAEIEASRQRLKDQGGQH